MMSTRWLANLGLSGAALAAAALVLSGCQAKGATGGCGVIGSCGGNPTGAWMVKSSCTFKAVTRMAQNYANNAPYYEPETGAAAPAVTSGTQCWDLTFDKDGNLATPKTPVNNPDYVISGIVTFFPDQSYTYGLIAISQTAFHIARSCLGVNGANLGPNGTPTTCEILADKMNLSIPASTTTYMSLDATMPSFRCVKAGDGCDCLFNFTEVDTNSVGDKGTWVVEQGSNIIHHYSIAGQGNFYETNPSRRTVRDATFCVSPDRQTLELTGTNGTALALKAGTRSLTLTRIPPEPDAGTGGTGGSGGGGGVVGVGGAGGEGGAGGAGGADGAAGTDGGGSDGAVTDADDASAG